MRERARVELSNYKVPRRIVVVAAGELPSLPNGKPDRLAIRRLLEPSSAQPDGNATTATPGASRVP